MQKLLSSTEVGDLIGVGRETIVDYAASGRLVGSQIGKVWRFRPEDVEEFVKSQRRSKVK